MASLSRRELEDLVHVVLEWLDEPDRRRRVHEIDNEGPFAHYVQEYTPASERELVRVIRRLAGGTDGMTMNKALLGGAALGLLLVAGWVWLAMWADEREQRFFIARERIPSWAHGQ
jgi:hypothetical protein